MLDYEDSTSVLVVRLGSRCDTPLGDLKRWLPCPTRAPIILCISDSLPCHFAGDRRLPEQAFKAHSNMATTTIKPASVRLDAPGLRLCFQPDDVALVGVGHVVVRRIRVQPLPDRLIAQALRRTHITLQDCAAKYMGKRGSCSHMPLNDNSTALL